MATKITGTVSGEPLIEYEVGGVFVPWKQAIDNWATVTAVTGSPTTGTYTDADGIEWTYYQWTGNGSVTTTEGVVDVLLVGGGGINATYGGYGGYSVQGLHSLTAQAHSVVVGSYGGYGNANRQGGESSLGSLVARGGAGGAQSYSSGAPGLAGFTSAITGTALTYSRTFASSTSRANSGDGGSTTYVGAAGVVIIRVPSTFAQA